MVVMVLVRYGSVMAVLDCYNITFRNGQLPSAFMRLPTFAKPMPALIAMLSTACQFGSGMSA